MTMKRMTRGNSNKFRSYKEATKKFAKSNSHETILKGKILQRMNEKIEHFGFIFVNKLLIYDIYFW